VGTDNEYLFITELCPTLEHTPPAMVLTTVEHDTILFILVIGLFGILADIPACDFVRGNIRCNDIPGFQGYHIEVEPVLIVADTFHTLLCFPNLSTSRARGEELFFFSKLLEHDIFFISRRTVAVGFSLFDAVKSQSILRHTRQFTMNLAWNTHFLRAS